MTPVQGLILGIVQGLTEFLPISSSAHLVLVPWLLGWPRHSLTFDVALHMGTLGALLIYFWRDLWRLVAAWLPEQPEPPGVSGEPSMAAPAAPMERPGYVGASAGPAGEVMAAASGTDERALRRRIGIGLIIGSVPAAAAGALFAEQIEASLRAPVLVAVLLIVAGALLAAADRAGVQDRGLESVQHWQALTLGVAQALALAPGVSRSGVTLAVALLLGFRREAAARYAFLLGVPITGGAGVFQLRHLLQGGLPPDERLAFLIGVSTSLIVGLIAIGGLLRYLRHGNLDVFVSYRLFAGVLVLLVAGLGLR